MASLLDFQVKLMQLQTRVSRINRGILNYLLKMILENEHDLPSPVSGKDGPITISDLRDSLLDSNNDRMWEDYFSEIDARIASKKYKPDPLFSLFENKPFKKFILRVLHSAHDLVLGFALHLSGTTGAEKPPSGLASMKVNLLNRKDPNILKVLDTVRDINEAVECVEMMDPAKGKTKKG